MTKRWAVFFAERPQGDSLYMCQMISEEFGIPLCDMAAIVEESRNRMDPLTASYIHRNDSGTIEKLYPDLLERWVNLNDPKYGICVHGFPLNQWQASHLPNIFDGSWRVFLLSYHDAAGIPWVKTMHPVPRLSGLFERLKVPEMYRSLKDYPLRVEAVYPQDVFSGLPQGCTRMTPLSAAPVLEKMMKLSESRRRTTSFPGSHPVNVTENNVHLLGEQEYAVSPKIDGTRFLLVVHDGHAFFVTRKLDVFVCPEEDECCFDSWDESLFDCEVTPDGCVVILDVINSCGSCVRSLGLVERLQTGCDFSAQMKRIWDDCVVQEYHHMCHLPSVLEELDEPGVDGLVFTPVRSSYRLGKNESLLKYKDPFAECTVDLLVKLVPDQVFGGNTIIGHTYGRKGELIPEGVIGFPGMDRECEEAGDNMIAECLIEDPRPGVTEDSALTLLPRSFVFRRWRHDKDRPNFSEVLDSLARLRDTGFGRFELLEVLGFDEEGSSSTFSDLSSSSDDEA